MKQTLSAFSLFSIFSLPIQADGFNVSEVLGGAVDLMQQGIDMLWPDDLSLDDMKTKVGVGFGFTPDYIGSNNYALRVIPLLDLQYGERLRLTGSKLTWDAIHTEHFTFGPLLNLRFGRAENANPVLAGLGSVSTTLETGAFAKLKYKAGFITGEYRHGLGAGIYSRLQLTAGHGIFKSENFVAMATLRLRWQDYRTAMTQFGITKQQLSNSVSGFTPYQAAPGVYDITANILGSYTVNEKTRLVGLVSYGKLVNSAARSPLVAQAGSNNQFIVGTGLVFSF